MAENGLPCEVILSGRHFLKEQLTQKWKMSESQVEFSSPQNISGASQQNSAATFC